MPNSIKKLRERAGLTQSQLAKMAKVDQANLSQWENGNKMMREDTIRKLCNALDCTPTKLMKMSKNVR